VTAIALHSVTLERFQSFRKRTTIVFTEKSGFKFLTGRNMVEPRLGANGAGKSTVFEAVTWGLFGTTSNGDRASEVVTYGDKKPHVSVKVLVDGTPKTIVREGSPNRLTIEGKVVEQEDVDKLIGLSKNRFLQTVLFGQGAPLFFDLSVPERGALLDDVFSISYWLERSDNAGKLEQIAQREVLDIVNQIAGIDVGLKSFSEDQETHLEKQASAWKSARQARINAAIEEIATQEDKLTSLDRRKADVKSAIANAAHAQDLSDLTTEQRRTEISVELARTELAKSRELVKFYNHAERCPTCKQQISEQFRKTELKRLNLETENKQREIADLDRCNEQRRQQIAKVNTANAQLQRQTTELELERRQIQIEQDALNRIIDAIEARIEAEGKLSDNPYTEELARFREQRSRLERNKMRLVVRRDNRQVRLEALRYWKQTFKRVRLYLLKQVLDSLTVEIAAAASALGLPTWKIALTTETETKSGTIKPGIQITVTSPDNASRKRYSGGEHQRIKLAISIGLANMIQRMAGGTFDFEIWDEPTQFLSEEGISDLLECLSYRAQSTKKSIYLLDHRSLNYGFDETIFIEKTHEGSRVRV